MSLSTGNYGPPVALTRSQQMARIRGKDTGPELRLRKALWAAGLRYRKHARTPEGRPDVVFPGPRVAVFIDGCFWHGCPSHYVRPRSRGQFWADKLATNVLRDRRQTLALEGQGWRVIRIWEHAVYEELEQVVESVEDCLRAGALLHAPDWRVVKVVEVRADPVIETRHQELLRDSESRRCTTGLRITTKWRRPPRSGRV